MVVADVPSAFSIYSESARERTRQEPACGQQGRSHSRPSPGRRNRPAIRLGRPWRRCHCGWQGETSPVSHPAPDGWAIDPHIPRTPPPAASDTSETSGLPARARIDKTPSRGLRSPYACARKWRKDRRLRIPYALPGASPRVYQPRRMRRH